MKSKKTAQPTPAQMNKLLALFNQKALAQAESLALDMTQRYAKHGFGWKVLGALYQHTGKVEDALHALKKAVEFLPNDFEAHYNLANYYYDQQQTDAAVICYRKAIKLNSNFSQAYYNLGNALESQQSLEEAAASYQKGLLIDPNNVQILCNLGHVLYELNKYVEAKNCYKKALLIKEDFSVAHLGMAAVLKMTNFPQEAEEGFRRAIHLDPNNIDAYKNLGELLKDLGRFEESESYYKEAIALAPESADGYVKVGILLRTSGKVKESIHYFNEALRLDPTSKEINNDTGLAWAELGLYHNAESYYKKALEIDPEFWVTYNNFGLTLHLTGKLEEAESAFNKALELNPDQALIYSNLSLPLTASGQIKKATNCLKKAIEISPDYVNAHINLCANYLAQGMAQSAEDACVAAIKLQPNSVKARSNLLFTMNYSGHHSPEYRLQQACEFDQTATNNVNAAFTHWQSKYGGKRLRVGLVSADMRQHPVAYFLENWARNVDFSKIELIAYLTDNSEDAITGRLKPNFSEWHSLLGMSDEVAAKLIHDDAIDILMDLSGHTSGNRLQIFAYKPAPIQVSWIGYFATTGLKTMDYFIADAVGVPEANKSQFVENIKYLPDTRLCFTAPNAQIKITPLPAAANKYITFGSFQTLVKAGDEVLTLWAEVMRALPMSKLRWQCKSFGDPLVAAEIIERLARSGVNANRVTLLGSVSREEYLAAHAEVDVILDTFPFPGGTTTCEALWMGVPTLTLAGETLIARQGASMLTAAGLHDWVVDNKLDYVRQALKLCNDLDKLSILRAELRAKVLASPLFNAKHFAKNMETALWEMWEDYQSQMTTERDANNDNLKHEALANDQLQFGAKKRLAGPVHIISATRYTEDEFWRQSALGLSLPRHLKQSGSLSVQIAFENARKIPEVFNEAIALAGDDAILVFMHDDVWIDEANFTDALVAGLARFDLLGVVGNARRLPNQPAWCFVDKKFNLDDSVNLSGQLGYGPHAFGTVTHYGDVEKECELLSGVFLAARKSSLIKHGIIFDKQFDFHFYDLDLCRSAKSAGLSLGTWMINLTHQSEIEVGGANWVNQYQLYINKWDSAPHYNVELNLELQEAINDVLKLAFEHQQAGRLEQAELLYQEVLSIAPQHEEANRNLLVIESHLNNA